MASKVSDEAEGPKEPKEPFKRLVAKKGRTENVDRSSATKAKRRKALASLRKRRKWIPSNITGDKKMAENRRKLFATAAMFGSKILCKFCSKTFVGCRNYFDHVRQDHVRPKASVEQIPDAPKSSEASAPSSEPSSEDASKKTKVNVYFFAEVQTHFLHPK